MKRSGSLLVAAGLIAAATCLAQRAAPDAAAAKTRYEALVKEFELASSGGVLTDEERRAFIGRVFRARNRLGLELIELAEKFPQERFAVDALANAAWQVNTTPWPVELVGPDDASRPALSLLAKRHIDSDRLGAVCERLANGFREEYEPFLRTVFAKSPHRGVRARAGLALAHLLQNRQQRLAVLGDDPALRSEFAGLYGKDYLATLDKQDRDATLKESERLFERVLREFGNVALPEGDTVADRAQSSLYELRHLSPGNTAPEIEGKDQDGNPFALRELRGKVVLLDFWSRY